MGELLPRQRYRDQIVAIVDAILFNQSDTLDAVRDVVANALSSDRLIYVAGSGHSHILAEEVFYRAGGIAAAQA
ncbi:MAG: SIS domain-containing protein, partial [Devosia sp.]